MNGSKRIFAVAGVLGLLFLGVSRTECFRLGMAGIRECDRFVATCVNENEGCPATVQPDLLAKLRSKGVPLVKADRYGQEPIDDRTWKLSDGLRAPDNTFLWFEAEGVRAGTGSGSCASRRSRCTRAR